MHITRATIALFASIAVTILTGCGGGSEGQGVTSPSVANSAASTSSAAPVLAPLVPLIQPIPTTQSPPTALPLSQLSVAKFEFVQTHVLPADGLNWVTAKDSQSLHLVGRRDTLVMAKIGQSDAQNPVLEVWSNGSRKAEIPMAQPTALAHTEAEGVHYADDRWSVTVPAKLVVPGVSFRVAASNYVSSSESAPTVGLDSDMTLAVMPFYLFGANDVNTFPYSVTKGPTLAQQAEMVSELPIAQLSVDSVGRLDWAKLVVPPRNDTAGVAQPAYVMTSIDQQKDSFATLAAAISLLARFKEANGDGPVAKPYYAPILAIDKNTGKFKAIGGGLGTIGAGVAAGDHLFSGITIHELGHGFGLDHADGAYSAGYYPYVGGSLKGSVWGFDASRSLFLNTLIPLTAANFNGCTTKRQLDASGACIKQDPMQSGAGDQAAGSTYTMFADFSVGKIQRWFEGVTTIDNNGVKVYTGGKILIDSSSATGYSRWDSIAKSRVEVSANTTNSKGLYGTINQGLPIQRDVQVHALAISRSATGTVDATQIYPPLTKFGNLIRLIDPTNPQDLIDITPGGAGRYASYCTASGCDYTVRVTYVDGSLIYRVLSGSFRPFATPTAAYTAASLNATDADSFKTWVIQVPGSIGIQKVELLDTPTVWKGLPANPAVLATR